MKIQFIAGAKCPKCGEIDVIQQITEADGAKHWRCVDCDFTADSESLPESAAIEAPEQPVTIQPVTLKPSRS